MERMWCSSRAISRLRHIRKLYLVSPPAHSSPTFSPAYPRINPEPQLLNPIGLGFKHAIKPGQLEGGIEAKERAVAQGGWGLGPAWEKLEVLVLDNLGQVGVRATAPLLNRLPNRPKISFRTLHYSPSLHLNFTLSRSRQISWTLPF